MLKECKELVVKINGQEIKTVQELKMESYITSCQRKNAKGVSNCK